MANTTQNPQSKYRLFLTVWVIVCVAVLFSVLEIASRVLKIGPPLENQYASYVADDKVGYRHQPNSTVKGRSGHDEFDFEYKHNSLGFRDREHAVQKPKNSFRILGLGDSFTYGAGADFSKTYLQQLEDLLNKRGGNHPRAEVIKAGVSRSFPEMQRLILDAYGVQFQPDIITVGFLPNDIVDTYMAEESVTVTADHRLQVGKQSLGKFGDWLYRSSIFWRWLRFKIFEKKQKLSWHMMYSDNPVNAGAWVKIFDEYSRMNLTAQKNNARLVLVFIPQDRHWDGDVQFLEQKLKKWAAEQGIPFVETVKAFKAAIKNGVKTHWDKDGHCTPAGYSIIADRLFWTLNSASLVP